MGQQSKLKIKKIERQKSKVGSRKKSQNTCINSHESKAVSQTIKFKIQLEDKFYYITKPRILFMCVLI